MQFTLNFDLSITAKTRQATLREQRKRKKQKKQRQSQQMLAQKQLLAQQSKFSLLDIDDDDIDVSFTYCHSFSVNEQSFVIFRESQYIVNDQNEMK